MDAFLEAIKQYANFQGRARRKDYWMYVLFYIIFYVVLLTLDVIVGIGFLALIYALALLIPSISVAARRLHDTGRSGWWQLIYFVPLIGLIVMIVFLVQDSEAGENQYGPNPKQ